MLPLYFISSSLINRQPVILFSNHGKIYLGVIVGNECIHLYHYSMKLSISKPITNYRDIGEITKRNSE